MDIEARIQLYYRSLSLRTLFPPCLSTSLNFLKVISICLNDVRRAQANPNVRIIYINIMTPLMPFIIYLSYCIVLFVVTCSEWQQSTHCQEVENEGYATKPIITSRLIEGSLYFRLGYKIRVH